MKWDPYKAVQAAPKLPVADPNRTEDLRQRQREALRKMGGKSLIAYPINDELRRLGRL